MTLGDIEFRGVLIDLHGFNVQHSITVASWFPTVLVDALVLVIVGAFLILANIHLLFNELILERRDRKQVLEQEIQTDQGVELKIAVLLAFK